jgi:hypothetical protein
LSWSETNTRLHFPCHEKTFRISFTETQWGVFMSPMRNVISIPGELHAQFCVEVAKRKMAGEPINKQEAAAQAVRGWIRNGKVKAVRRRGQ